MTTITWLHLSDWHQGGPDFNRQVVADALIKDIRERADRIAPELARLDFIVFSGDVAFSGQRAQYVRAAEFLFEPVLEATGLTKDRLFVIPGNHDIDRHAFELLPAAILTPFTSEAQMQEWLLDEKKRNRLLEPFEAYDTFVREYLGPDYSSYASIRRLEIDGHHIALLGLNSALMCGRHLDEDGEVDDARHLVVGEPQVYSALRQIQDADIRIAVLHHPFDFLKDYDRDKIEQRLGTSCHFILRGHLHRQETYNVRGTRGDHLLIPAGASYGGRKTADPRYANAYNLVSHDPDSGATSIYFRHWNDIVGEWSAFTDLYPDGRYMTAVPRSGVTSSSPLGPFISGRSETELPRELQLAKEVLHRGPPLPKVREIDPYHDLGVFRSDIAERFRRGGKLPPYVRRDVDDALNSALTDARDLHGPVLIVLVGPSKAGKSRTAYEACLRTFPDQPFIVPRRLEPQRLAQLAEFYPALKVDSEPAILWFDDIQDFLSAAGLDATMVQQWRQGKPRIVAVGTLRSDEYRSLARARDKTGRLALSVFDNARVIHLRSTLSGSEKSGAIKHYGRGFADNLGERIAATKELLDKFRSGETESPVGFALVRAAIDWRRIGHSRPILESELKELYRRFLPSSLRHAEDDYQRGIAWAQEPVASSAALISETWDSGARAFQVFDYILEYWNERGEEIDASFTSIPPEVWEFAINHASPSAAVAIGAVARERGNLHEAEIAYKKALSGPAHVAMRAAQGLGYVLRDQGDLERAEEAFRRAIDLGEPGPAAMAWLDLGELLSKRDPEGAKQAYQRATELGNPDTAAWAWSGLAALLRDRGDPEGAKQAYQRATELGNPDTAAWAWSGLAALLRDRGDPEGAKQAYQRATELGNPNTAAWAWFNQGRLLRDQGDLERAEQAFRQSIDLGNSNTAAWAWDSLGGLLQDRGDPGGAEQAFRQSIDLGDPDTAAWAWDSLGRLLQDRGDPEGAEQAFRRAIDSNVPNNASASWAAYHLGGLLSDQSNPEGAEWAFQRAIELGGPDMAARAWLALGDLLRDRGNPGGAEDAYRRAITLKAKASSTAQHRLDELLEESR
jgi:tetratricopeptide (TPR) repeat protein/3',5'-cyclic AMP phosphodiesterase CpdA